MEIEHNLIIEYILDYWKSWMKNNNYIRRIKTKWDYIWGKKWNEMIKNAFAWKLVLQMKPNKGLQLPFRIYLINAKMNA